MNDVRPEKVTPVRGNEARPFRGAASAALRVLCAFLILATFALAYVEGRLHNLLILFVILMTAATVLARLWGAVRGRLELGLIRHPLSRPTRPVLLQCLNRSMFWGMTAISLALSIIPIQLQPVEYLSIWVILGISLVTLALSQLVPPRRIRLLGNILYAMGWVFLAVECVRVIAPRSTAGAAVLSPPFRGEWVVLQGGRSALVNHHYLIPSQSDALDLVMPIDGQRVNGNPDRLESYAAYGQPLFAPADGRVSRVINDRDDMAIGQTDVELLVGNHVVIEMASRRYVLLAHLKKGSIVVSEGEQVRRGQPIAACGNSGNTSEPHLHLQVQSAPVFALRGLTTVPIVLREIELVRWGRHSRGTIGNLRRNDHIIALSR
jgi:hypothetical protein